MQEPGRSPRRGRQENTPPPFRGRRSETVRTTITLPASALRTASEEGLRDRARAIDRSRRILELWRKACVPRDEEERLLLEGIVLEESE